MTGKLISQTTVAYADVDRRELMLLPRIFKMLQDAAIAHANQFGTGTEAVTTRAETWVLNRIAADVERYPRPDEELRVETWSSGIKGFKGYRDFRVYDDRGQQIISASSLWLYVSTVTKTIVRVPRDLIDGFPVGPDPVWCPALETLPLEAPEGGTVVPISLRYSDFDVNEHVNNAAYLDIVQSALAAVGNDVHPRSIRLKYAKAIPTGTERVEVRLAKDGAVTRFSVERDARSFAVGEVGG